MLRISIGKVIRFVEFGKTDTSAKWQGSDPIKLVMVEKEHYPKTNMEMVAMVYPCSLDKAKRLIQNNTVKYHIMPNGLASIVWDSAMNGVIGKVNGAKHDMAAG